MGGNWRKRALLYAAAAAALFAGLLVAELTGPSGRVSAPTAPDSIEFETVGNSSSKATKQCDDEDPNCKNSTASGSLDGDCPVGTTLVAKFEVKGGKYVFEGPSGNQNVVTLSNATTSGGSWASTVLIKAVVVKASTDVKVTTYDPPLGNGTFSNVGMVGSGGQPQPEISNIRFCA